MTNSPRGLRCAIYTRKSSEEGLEQSFNSLHAQREACEAYIKSQAHEGWVCLPACYDDGGFSGGTMDRPGLTALMADIDRGQIDIVVVYKVDRLTRSLMDFAKIVDAFDLRKVSFVSVTQAFNTTTSMGRLTLNVLLSFAQFEREVTGERIRDKIAASKKKGLWMGGNLPLGYERQDNTLAINPAEAEQVRTIFERYLAVGSVDNLRSELAARGIRSKRRVTRKGDTIGGENFSRGALYHLLSNQHYRGLIRHKDQVHAGLHSAIIDEPLFDAVQSRLAEQRVMRSTRTTRPAAARLVGRLFLQDGTPLTPSFAYGRGGRSYSYYIASGDKGDEGPLQAPPRRLPAAPLEMFVQEALARMVGDPDASWVALSPLLIKIEVRSEEVHLILNSEKLFGDESVELAQDALRARLSSDERLLSEAQPGGMRLCIRRRLSFRGGRSWLIDGKEPAAVKPSLDPILIDGLKNAHATLATAGVDPNAHKFSRDAKSPVHPYQRKLCLLAMLAPDLQVAVVEGRIPRNVTLHDLISGSPMPLLWRDQRDWLFRRGQETGDHRVGAKRQ
jgi:site-specific DNA recombinase